MPSRTGAGRKPARAVGLLLFLFGAAPVAAQIFPGHISGSVRDPSGAAIAGAQVTLTAPAVKLGRTAVTDASGYFDFPQLPLGSYELTVSKNGFKTSVSSGITTEFGKVNTVDVKLELGAVSSRVEVKAAAPLLQTATNASGGSLTARQVQTLPYGNSDYTRLPFYLPGVNQYQGNTFVQFSINGSLGRSVSFNIDGTYDTDAYRQLPSINEGGNSATAATRLPPDAIQEVTLVSAGGAETGQSSGGVLEATIRSGTNEFHGTVYEFHRDASLDAKNFFENLNGIQKAPFVWNEFGFSAGGPIVLPHIYNGKDRTFIFGSYDGSRLRLGTTLSGNAPTEAQVNQAIALLQQHFGSGFQPNPLGLDILKFYQPLSGRFAVDNSGRQSPDNFVIKVDHNATSSDLISGRILAADGLDEFPQGGQGPGGGSQLEQFFGVTPVKVVNSAVSWLHTFSPGLLNTFRIGFNRIKEGFFSRDQTFDPASIGLNTGVQPQDFGLPEIDIGSGPNRFSNLGINPSFPRERFSNSLQVVDDVAFSKGPHDLRFGASWMISKIYGFNDNGFRGLLTFDGSQLGDSLTGDGGVAGLVDLLAGMPTPGKTFINRGTTRFDVHQNIVGLYGIDTVKLRPSLTLIAGLRWDFIGVPREDRGRFSDFLPGVGLVKVSQLPGDKLYANHFKNFAPRIALAYSPPFRLGGRQMVIRAGYGIFYNISPLDVLVGQTFNIATANPGVATNPIGGTGVFSVTPSAPIPFQPGVPIFGPPSPSPPFNIQAIDPNLEPTNAQVWNFNVQQEIARDMVLQLAYVGSKGTHLLHLLDINQPSPGDPATADLRRPFHDQFPQFREISTLKSIGNSNYHSLQLSLQSRNFHGLTSQLSYTWSHLISTGDETLDFFGTSGFQPQDSNNLNAERGTSQLDIRQSFVYSYIYAFPRFLPGTRWERMVNGWEVAGVVTKRTGQHEPILTFDNVSGTNEFHDRPNCVGPVITQLSDFTKPYVVSGLAEPAPGTFGNCPRNPVTTPGLVDADLSLIKNTKITERVGAQFRVDFYNAFNKPNFGLPIPVLGAEFVTNTVDESNFDSHFGQGAPRNIQFNLKLTW